MASPPSPLHCMAPPSPCCCRCIFKADSKRWEADRSVNTCVGPAVYTVPVPLSVADWAHGQPCEFLLVWWGRGGVSSQFYFAFKLHHESSLTPLCMFKAHIHMFLLIICMYLLPVFFTIRFLAFSLQIWNILLYRRGSSSLSLINTDNIFSQVVFWLCSGRGASPMCPSRTCVLYIFASHTPIDLEFIPRLQHRECTGLYLSPGGWLVVPLPFI